jgi:heme/copper-type cytochrome/quinol oxidase subunit 4
MAEPQHEHADAAHAAHDTTVAFRRYMIIFVALCVFTGLSFVFNELARRDVIAHMTSVWLIVLVAIIKAVCVALIFMHLNIDWGKVYAIIVPVGIMAVMMVIVLLPDIVLSRSARPFPYPSDDGAAAPAVHKKH